MVADNYSTESLEFAKVVLALVAVEVAVELCVSRGNYPAAAEVAVALTLEEHDWVVAVGLRVSLPQLNAGVFAVADRVVVSVLAAHALAGAEAFDVGGEVESEVDFGHSLDKFRLNQGGGTWGMP